MANLDNITRRRILKLIPAAATAAAVPAVATAGTEPKMSARERVDYLVAELKAALLEANPDVRVGSVFVNLDDRDPRFLYCSLLVG